ncbi:MAG TPA: SUMF1/EgtB/PvdO family nonheme iron enzyme, partial [Kofleriaceae bacterium]
LRRDPTERFASGDAVRDALEALAAGDQTAASRYARPPRARRLRRLGLTGAGLALALLAYKRFGGEHAPRSAPAPRSMVRFAAATVRPGVFDTSRRPEVCSSLAEAEDCAVLTSPERVTPVRVEAFELDVREVTSGELAEWLNAIGSLWTTDPYGRITTRQGGIPLVLASEDCFGALAVTTAGRVVASPDKMRWPAACVTWHGANEYCRAQHKRLPLAVEWELAAKGAEGRPFPWGSDLPTPDGVAFDLRDGAEPHPREAGSSPKDVTPEGVHDLGGNVAEWVEEDRGVSDTQMIRGGSWGSRGPCHLLGSGCKRIAVAKYSKDVGFRCASSVTEGQ